MRNVVVVIILVVLVFLVIDFNSRTTELNRLKAEREVISVRLSNRLQTQSALESEFLEATSEAAPEEYGYENKMGREGDYLVVPVAPYESTPTPMPMPVVVVTQETNLQRWLSLFLDPANPTPIP